MSSSSTAKSDLPATSQYPIALFSKRPAGKPCAPEEWDKQTLPRPSACAAVGAIELKPVFKERCKPFRKLLRFEGSHNVTVLADGEPSIWKSAEEVFYEPNEV